MQAMLFEAAHAPLRLAAVARPEPGPNQVLIQVRAGRRSPSTAHPGNSVDRPQALGHRPQRRHGAPVYFVHHLGETGVDRARST